MTDEVLSWRHFNPKESVKTFRFPFKTTTTTFPQLNLTNRPQLQNVYLQDL
jgi:hypothetical protein